MLELLNEFLLLSKTESPLSESVLEECQRRYDAVLTKGCRLRPRQKEGEKRGNQSKACNPLGHSEDCDQCVLAFLRDPQLSFINNQAEQDIRMVKFKQKISGSFRTLTGVRLFARIRGFFSTARKQGCKLLESITNGLKGAPFISTPSIPASG